MRQLWNAGVPLSNLTKMTTVRHVDSSPSKVTVLLFIIAICASEDYLVMIAVAERTLFFVSKHISTQTAIRTFDCTLQPDYPHVL